jgi:hypothetical protein
MPTILSRYAEVLSGFAMATPHELTDDERDALLDQLADQVAARGMAVPATLFLEMHRPFAFLASQGLLVATPFLAALFGMSLVQRWTRLLEQPENVSRLVERMAVRAAERTCNTRPSR